MRNDSIQSRTIECLRFFCAVLVVFIHTFEPLGPRGASYKNGIYDVVRILISQGFCRVAVPIFFLFSGFLFFIKLEDWNRQVWINKLKKRVHTLLIPYFLWNLIAIAASLYFYFAGENSPNLVSWFKSIGGLRAFWNSISGLWPIDGPLWFVRNLIILVILSPIIHLYLKRTGIIGLLILGILYIFRWWKEIPGFEIAGIMFFSLGGFFSIQKIDFSLFFKKYRLLTSCISIPLLIGIVFTYGIYNKQYYILRYIFTLVGSASVIGIVSSLIEKNRLSVSTFLSNSSFFIFAAHNVYLLSKIMLYTKRLFPSPSQIAMIIKYISIPTIVIAILLGCYYVLNRWTPKFLAFLTGGR